jgi:hypothetical protein
MQLGEKQKGSSQHDEFNSQCGVNDGGSFPAATMRMTKN